MSAPTVDFRSWLRRAEAFVRQTNQLPGEWALTVDIEPPVSIQEMDNLTKEQLRGLPDSLRDFYTSGSANCTCHYRWTPNDEVYGELEPIFSNQSYYGGPRIMAWADWQKGHGYDGRDWWDGQEDELGEEQQRSLQIWRNCIRFIEVGNGDAVALHNSGDPNRLPVYYLSHDDPESPVTYLSPSFQQFLVDWETLGYIGPEIWLLGAFLGQGGLDVNQEKAQRWRQWLRLHLPAATETD